MGLRDLFKRNNSNDSEKYNNNKNFTYLNDLIHNGQKEILLDENIILDTSFQYKEHIKFIKGLSLDVDNLVIDGNGHTIDAKSKIPIFQCLGDNITLKNITFKNGSSNITGGGALLNEENCNLNILSCNFLNNVSNNAGGAITSLNGSILNIEGTVFEGNSAGIGGGAIASFGKISLDNCKFYNNFAKKVAGAINNQKSGVLTVKNTKFIDNHSNMDAGAIGNLGKCSLDNCEFSKNNSKEYGDAIFNQPSAILNINNVNFINHNVNYAILFNQGELNLNEGIFKENKSGKADCLIYSDSESSLICSNYKFFKNNYKKGACINNGSDNARFTECSFCNNKNNSVIFNTNSIDLIDCEFDNNESNFYIIDSFDKQSTLKLSGGSLSNNSAKTTIFNSGKSCKIVDTLFKNNYSFSGSANDIINESNLNIEFIGNKVEDSYEKSNRKLILNNGNLDIGNKNKLNQEIIEFFVEIHVENYGKINYYDIPNN